MTDTLTEALIGADFLEQHGQTTCEAVREVVDRLQNPSPLQTIRNIIRDHRIVRGVNVEEIEVSHEFYQRLRVHMDEMAMTRPGIDPPSSWTELWIYGVLITRTPHTPFRSTVNYDLPFRITEEGVREFGNLYRNTFVSMDPSTVRPLDHTVVCSSCGTTISPPDGPFPCDCENAHRMNPHTGEITLIRRTQ